MKIDEDLIVQWEERFFTDLAEKCHFLSLNALQKFINLSDSLETSYTKYSNILLFNISWMNIDYKLSRGYWPFYTLEVILKSDSEWFRINAMCNM